MKKRVCFLALAAAMLITFAGCGGAGDMANDMENDMNNLEEGLENDGQMQQDDGMGTTDNMQDGAGVGNNMQGNAQAVTRYSENDVEFDVPESWQNNFMAVFDEHNASTSQGYSTIDFYYSNANSPYKIMTIGRFPKGVWETMKKNDTQAEEKKLGESKDGEWIYSLNYEAQQLSDDEAYLTAKADAEKLKDKIKITR